VRKRIRRKTLSISNHGCESPGIRRSARNRGGVVAVIASPRVRDCDAGSCSGASTIGVGNARASEASARARQDTRDRCSLPSEATSARSQGDARDAILLNFEALSARAIHAFKVYRAVSVDDAFPVARLL
jgi:hypothetical protein